MLTTRQQEIITSLQIHRSSLANRVAENTLLPESADESLVAYGNLYYLEKEFYSQLNDLKVTIEKARKKIKELDEKGLL